MPRLENFLTVRPGQYSWFSLATILMFVATLTVGGASQGNAIQVAILGLLALCLAPFAVQRLADAGLARPMRPVIAIMVAIILLPVLQLVPLPPELWIRLPGRDLTAGAFNAAGLATPWQPLSMTPALTLQCLLALIAPVVLFLSFLTLTAKERTLAGMALILVAFASLGVGALQVAGGETSPAYFYETTNYGSMVGFFSNRNHEATLLLCTLPFVGAAAADFGGQKRQVAGLILCLSVFLAIAIALMAVRSRAGFFLLVPVMLATITLVWRGGLFGTKRKIVLIVAMAGVGVAATLVYFLGLRPILERLTESVADDIRFEVAPRIWAAAVAHMPFGTGFGSFDPIFRSIEPVEIVTPTYLNHAHNDWLEVWLEAGWPGAIVFLAFIGWFLSTSFKQWTGRGQNLSPLAATISIAAIVLHSTLDYPLRTIAIMSVLAFSCALTTPTSTWTETLLKPSAGHTRVKVRTRSRRASTVSS